MKNPFVYLAIGILKIYKVTLSPAFRALGIHCRHTPDCANYSIEAFSLHGVWRGFWLTLSRLSVVIRGDHRDLILYRLASISKTSKCRGNSVIGVGKNAQGKALVLIKTSDK